MNWKFKCIEDALKIHNALKIHQQLKYTNNTNDLTKKRLKIQSYWKCKFTKISLALKKDMHQNTNSGEGHMPKNVNTLLMMCKITLMQMYFQGHLSTLKNYFECTLNSLHCKRTKNNKSLRLSLIAVHFIWAKHSLSSMFSLHFSHPVCVCWSVASSYHLFRPLWQFYWALSLKGSLLFKVKTTLKWLLRLKSKDC